ncbi:hypothetical protein [Pleionea sediminis]|uniref:hypothetical protein n=1 Tax=Pleionea sediminis TaxID=2569479 RepID=UPI0013DD9C0C|nr:hypothetical protein [Pleionea sediminis]
MTIQYSAELDYSTKLKPNEFVQGCVVGNGVFGVIESGQPRIVRVLSSSHE